MGDEFRLDSMVRSLGAAILGVCLVFAVPEPAEASPLWELSGAATSQGPFSARMTASGTEATYFNPARLRGQSRSVELGSAILVGGLAIELDDRPANLDIPENIYDARIEDDQGRRSPPPTRPVPTDELPRERGSSDPSFSQPLVVFGIAVPIVSDRWVIGLHATMAADRFAHQNPHFSDEREQVFSNSLHFERLGDRVVGASFAVGSGVKIAEWLDLGLGMTMAQDATSDNAVFTPDATSPEEARTSTGIGVKIRPVPHVGVEARPASRLSLTGTVHGPFENRVDGTNELRLWNFPIGPDDEESLHQEVTYVYDFEPLRIAAGAVFDWGDERRGGAVGAKVRFGRWSQYRDRHGQRWPDEWRDTWSPTVTGQWRRRQHSWQADLRFTPSAIRPQEGRTNFVDNHRLSASAGWSRSFERMGRRFYGGLQVQFHRLLEQRVEKSESAPVPVIDEFPESRHVQTEEIIEESLDFRSNNPGYPGFRASGSVVGAGIFLGTEF